MVPWSDNGIFMAGILGVANVLIRSIYVVSFVSLILGLFTDIQANLFGMLMMLKKGKEAS